MLQIIECSAAIERLATMVEFFIKETQPIMSLEQRVAELESLLRELRRIVIKRFSINE